MPLTKETKQKIFEQLKSVMQKNAKPMVIASASNTGILIIGNIPVPYGSKKVMIPGMHFSSASICKDSIAFHFFPTYMNEKEFKPLAPETYKTLKGKTCFHFKKETDVNEKEIQELFKKGIAFYKKMGWIK